MRTSGVTGEVFKALAGFQDEVGIIPKGDDNPFFKSKYAGLPSVVEISQPILRKHGLLVVQTVGRISSADDHPGDVLATLVHHLPSGEWFEDTATLHLTPTGENQYLTAQAHGSAVTYMRRYAYVTALGLICDEDDDGNAASDTTSRRVPAPNKPKRTRRTKAEMEAAKPNEASPAEGDDGEEEIPVPSGWGDDRETCVTEHNALAERIGALSPAGKEACIAYKQEHGWPVNLEEFTTLATMVTVFEADVNAEVTA